MLNLLLIEDDLDLAETLVEYLAIEGLRCDHASNGMSGLHFIHQQHYDVNAQHVRRSQVTHLNRQ